MSLAGHILFLSAVKKPLLPDYPVGLTPALFLPFSLLTSITATMKEQSSHPSDLYLDPWPAALILMTTAVIQCLAFGLTACLGLKISPS